VTRDQPNYGTYASLPGFKRSKGDPLGRWPFCMKNARLCSFLRPGTSSDSGGSSSSNGASSTISLAPAVPGTAPFYLDSAFSSSSLSLSSISSCSSPRRSPVPDSTSNRKSWICETIREEAFDSPGGLAADSETNDYCQRHHRPRAAVLTRTQSEPQLISTTTTSPIHIQ